MSVVTVLVNDREIDNLDYDKIVVVVVVVVIIQFLDMIKIFSGI